MEKTKETNVKVWVFGLLLSVMFVTTVIWFALESTHGKDDPADIIRRLYIVGGAIVLLALFGAFIWWGAKAEKRKFENKIQTELGLKPISKMELFTKYINKDRFYAPIEWQKGNIVTEHIFHGEYEGYEICVIEPSQPPHFYWLDLGKFPWTAAVHIKSSSINFPKFVIKNKWPAKYFVIGDPKAQMRFAQPHILGFFNKTHRFGAQGRGNEFVFHEIDGEKGNYKLLIEHALTVLELLSKAAPYSSVSEIGKLEEKCRRAVKWKLLIMALIFILAAIFTWVLNH